MEKPAGRGRRKKPSEEARREESEGGSGCSEVGVPVLAALLKSEESRRNVESPSLAAWIVRVGLFLLGRASLQRASVLLSEHANSKAVSQRPPQRAAPSRVCAESL